MEKVRTGAEKIRKNKPFNAKMAKESKGVVVSLFGGENAPFLFVTVSGQHFIYSSAKLLVFCFEILGVVKGRFHPPVGID